MPAERDAIQAAIDGAAPGDTIVVGPGECLVSEPIDFRGKAIVLESERGADETVLRSAFAADPNDWDMWCATVRTLVVMESANPFEATLSGFTLNGSNLTAGTLLPLPFLCQPKWSEGKIDMGAGVVVRGAAAAVIVDCRFEDLVSRHGAAIAILGATVAVRRCSFLRCTTREACEDSFPGVNAGGGAVLVAQGGTATFEDCSFEDNFGDMGGGLLVQCGARALVTDCTFLRNAVGRSDFRGGSIACVDGDVEINRTLFDSGAATNSDYAEGGYLWLHEGAEARVYDTVFRRGRTRGAGGAVAAISYAQPTKLHMERCLFEANTAFSAGGALYASGDGEVSLIDCTFYSSIGNSGGGALCLAGTTARVSGCLILGSYAPAGAGIYTSRATLVLESSVIAESWHDAIHDEGFGDATHMVIRNSILWDAAFWRGANSVLFVPAPSIAVVEHSIIQGELWPGPGNMNVDPHFVGPDDAHLQPDSPAIDRGTEAGAPDRDLEGRARPCGKGIDIGIYELGECKLTQFRRGDVDGSGNLELTDALGVLAYLFQGASVLGCLDSADTQDSGGLDVADAVYLLLHLYRGGPPPPPPGEGCGEDPSPDTVACLVESVHCGEGG